MAYKFREEIVGKRFLSVSGFTKLKVNKISEWGWRTGVIRAASHRDNGCHDLQILVEYDDVEWQRREWLSPHRDTIFSFFLVEKGLYWAERPDPRHASLIAIDHHNHANNNHHHPRINGKPLRGATAVANTIAWPALTFYPLVARAELHEDAMPLEFMQDRRLDFVDYSKLKPFTQDWELTKGSVPWANAVRRWAEMQDGQRILLTTPSVLVGFRVEVYRAEGTTQWYTAVIVGYNESTKDLTVTDDTVLEDHNEDPSLVQMRLIGDGVVESIMRGEVVGMTPRRSRSSTALTHALVVPRPGRRPRGRPGNTTQLQTTPRIQSPISQHLEKDKNTARNSRRRRVSEGCSRDRLEKDTESTLSTPQEDRENKGPPSSRPSNRIPRTVLEEANSASSSASKLRKRGTIKSPVENQSQRSIRRRPRPGIQETTPIAEDLDQTLKSSDKEERLSRSSDEDDDQEPCDPLTKRLRTSPVSRKLRSDQKEDSEETLEEDRKEESSGKEAEKLEEDEESQSRERDREPEPPPPNKVDPGGDQVVQVSQNTDQVVLNGSVVEKSIIIDVESAVVKSEESKGLEEDQGSKDTELSTEVGTEDSVVRVPSVESVVELLESSSQDSGSVLERLSPLSSRQGLLLDQQREQDRSRNNESPVILAERLNKPPPGVHHHRLEYHQRYGSPVIHQQAPGSQQLASSSLLDVQQAHRGGDEASLMEVDAPGLSGSGVLPPVVGVRPLGPAAVSSGTYGDSGSDSGVSSLRSAGSGDERSGSRSSALSVEENSSGTPAAATPARVWHVQSVQHTSLLMAHPQTPQPGPSSATATPIAYQTSGPPGHHHPAVASEMLWRSPRYPPLPHALLGPTQHGADELFERERMVR